MPIAGRRGRSKRAQAAWKVPTVSVRAAGAEQRFQPLRHLARGLVGEGDRQDVVRADAASRDQVGDPVGDDAGLARARPGQDQTGPSIASTASRWSGFRPSSSGDSWVMCSVTIISATQSRRGVSAWKASSAARCC